MKNLFAIIFAIFSFSALADTKLSLMGSLHLTTPDTSDMALDETIDETSKIGFGAGLRALMGINNQLYFRSGVAIVQKAFSYDQTILGQTTDFDFSYTYLSVPLTLYWKASPQVGFFGGTSLNAKFADDCDSSGALQCQVKDEAAVVFPAILGFDFSFSQKIGMELSYEYGFMDTAKDLRIHSAVASFLYHLD